ncbi:hypothetical protein I546_3101 [Mycobacterium kansasii 732]|nr:hypothetical protein I546_3101 [Mycobacterium kansasii 732]
MGNAPRLTRSLFTFNVNANRPQNAPYERLPAEFIRNFVHNVAGVENPFRLARAVAAARDF